MAVSIRRIKFLLSRAAADSTAGKVGDTFWGVGVATEEEEDEAECESRITWSRMR